MQRYNFDNGNKIDLLKRAIPHICIILALPIIVFIIIDVFFNPAMGFVNNLGTKITMLVLCLATIINSVFSVTEHEKQNEPGTDSAGGEEDLLIKEQEKEEVNKEANFYAQNNNEKII